MAKKNPVWSAGFGSGMGNNIITVTQIMKATQKLRAVVLRCL